MFDAARSRLDAFVDAAFAFAVTLLVTGAGQAATASDGGLASVIGEAPAFLIGFSLIAMFWHAHVRWRGMAGQGGDSVPAVLLSLALVFLVLLYVYPLRLLALSLASTLGLGAAPDLAIGSLRTLFSLYALGFLLLSAAVALLFAGVAAKKTAEPSTRAVARGEVGIWSLLVGAGALSLVIAWLTPWPYAAPWVYAALPALIGLFVWRHDWTGVTAVKAAPEPS